MPVRLSRQLSQGVSSAGVSYENGSLVCAQTLEQSPGLGPGLGVRRGWSMDARAPQQICVAMAKLLTDMLEDAPTCVHDGVRLELSWVLQASLSPRLESPQLDEPLSLVWLDEPSVAIRHRSGEA